MWNIFVFKNNAQNEAGIPVPHPLFTPPTLIWRKGSGSLRLGHTIKANCIKFQAINQRMFNFDFSEKSMGVVSTLNFVYDFSRKIFLIPYSINWSSFMVWLPSLLSYWKICIVIISFWTDNVINFESKLSFFIKSFSCKIKKVRTKF